VVVAQQVRLAEVRVHSGEMFLVFVGRGAGEESPMVQALAVAAVTVVSPVAVEAAVEPETIRAALVGAVALA